MFISSFNFYKVSSTGFNSKTTPAKIEGAKPQYKVKIVGPGGGTLFAYSAHVKVARLVLVILVVRFPTGHHGKGCYNEEKSN